MKFLHFVVVFGFCVVFRVLNQTSLFASECQS